MEIGYLSYDAHAADLLFQVISRRYEQRSIVVTTNLLFKQWDTVFPNPSCAVALIDRLRHHAEIIRIGGRAIASARPNSHRRSGGPPRERRRLSVRRQRVQISTFLQGRRQLGGPTVAFSRGIESARMRKSVLHLFRLISSFEGSVSSGLCRRREIDSVEP